ncbi:MAG: (d)CMP kinase [Oscillospiraceae bacterium]|jgi:cytidylate kinase|nr:(d)CMP kinase [Oscillospiraceae bacterium]
MSINIAIDGPAGAGKSTIAREVAKKLGFIYVDTGALYRATALFVLQRNIDPYDSDRVNAVLPMADVELRYVGGEQMVYLCGENVSRVIRTPEVSKAASSISANPKVREMLFDLQQDIAYSNNVVMDGRDIATVILPDAQIKIFLTATAEERAARRYNELTEKGMKVSYEDVLEDVKARDYQDEHRAIAPLKQAADAVLVDTTGKNLQEATDLVLAVVSENMPL